MNIADRPTDTGAHEPDNPVLNVEGRLKRYAWKKELLDDGKTHYNAVPCIIAKQPDDNQGASVTWWGQHEKVKEQVPCTHHSDEKFVMMHPPPRGTYSFELHGEAKLFKNPAKLQQWIQDPTNPRRYTKKEYRPTKKQRQETPTDEKTGASAKKRTSQKKKAKNATAGYATKNSSDSPEARMDSGTAADGAATETKQPAKKPRTITSGADPSISPPDRKPPASIDSDSEGLVDISVSDLKTALGILHSIRKIQELSNSNQSTEDIDAPPYPVTALAGYQEKDLCYRLPRIAKKNPASLKPPPAGA